MTRSSTGRSKGPKREPPGVSLSFPAHATIFDPFHTPRRVYFLRSGRVKLSGDREVIFDVLKPGDFFGEKTLLAPQRRQQTAAAVSAVGAACWRASDFVECLQRDRRLALRVLRNLALRLDRYETTIRDFVRDPAEIRLARLLSRLLPRRREPAWARLPFRITNLEFARMTGTTRWRVSHFLHNFQKLGWLRIEGGIFVKLDGLTSYLTAWRRS